MKTCEKITGLRLLPALLAAVLVFFLVACVDAGEKPPAAPSPKDKCPVCGMFVAKYPDWIAQIVWKDGSRVFFDGAKDCFKYYLNLKKYSPARQAADIDSIYLKDYYSLGFIDGYKAWYVAGSDIYGPMGRELIPFGKEADAREFLKDHQGKSLLRFTDMNEALIKTLD